MEFFVCIEIWENTGAIADLRLFDTAEAADRWLDKESDLDGLAKKVMLVPVESEA